MELTICDPALCTGCMACMNACPVQAIEAVMDSEGFQRPHIIEEKCVNCHKCERICPAAQEREEETAQFSQQLYACWSKDKSIRRRSTSGGAFYELAAYVLQNHGVVYGAAFDGDGVVKHRSVDNIHDLRLLQGSKYVQSQIGYIFRDVQGQLDDGKTVLFSGTPCQVAGLKSCLKNPVAPNLITADLVCHGVPSPLILDEYLNYLQRMEKKTIEKQEVYFRDKNRSWAEFNMLVKFTDGSKYISESHEDPYLRGFLRNYFLRPSCHHCRFAKINRPSDITLADFWGYSSKSWKDFDDDRGVSLVLVNTDKGASLFSKVEGLNVFRRTLEEGTAGNRAFHSCFEENENRIAFWNDYDKSGFDYVVKKYMYPEPVSKWAAGKIATAHQGRVVFEIKKTAKKIRLLLQKR